MKGTLYRENFLRKDGTGMKRMRKLVSIITALCVMVTVLASFGTVSSAAEFTDVKYNAGYAEAVGLLASMGILDGYGDGTFKPDNTITRAEAATVMVRALGRDNDASGAEGNTDYSDVGKGDWESGYVNIATQMGIIDGFPDKTFKPDEPVTYEQIVKMVMCALGYDLMAQGKGGYPQGYLSVASSAGVTKGVKASAVGTPASRATVAQLVYNSLEVEMMEEISFSTGINGVTYGKNGKTILNDYLDMDKVDAVITDTYLTAETYSKRDKDIKMEITKIYGTKEHVNASRYELGDPYTFDEGDTDAAIYLGYTVTAYVGEDPDTGEDTIFGVTKHPSRNTEVEVTKSKLSAEDSNDTVIAYERKSTDRKLTELELDKRYTLVVNGEIVTDEVSDYFDDLDIMTLVDNDNDNDYEFVFISQFDETEGVEFVVDEIDEDRGEYSFIGENDDLDIDSEDEDICCTVIKDGKAADLDDIEVGDVITCLNASRDILTIYVSSKVIKGEITEYDSNEEEYYIDGKPFTLSPAFADSLDVGDEGTFYINYLGKIAYSTVNSTTVSGNYIFITNYGTEEKWNKTTYMLQGVNSSGRVVEYTLKTNRMRYVDESGNVVKDATAKTVFDYLTANKTDISHQFNVDGYAGIAKIKASSSGQLTEIYLPGKYKDFYSQTKYASDNDKEYSQSKEMYGRYDLSTNIVVFNIDDSEDDLADAVEVGEVADFFSDGDSYCFTAYGRRDKDIEAIVITDGIASIDYEKHAFIVTKVSTVSVNDQRTYKLTGLENGKSKTYTLDPDESYDVEVGNIVLVETGSDGLVSKLEFVALTTEDPGDFADALTDADIPSDTDANVYAGLVSQKNRKDFFIEGYDEESFYDDDTASYTLIDFTKRNPEYEGASFSGIKNTKDVETFVVVRMYDEEVIDVFMFRLDAGEYQGSSSSIWDHQPVIDDPDKPTEPETTPSEPETTPSEEESKTEPETAPSEEESKTEPETAPSEEESKTEPETAPSEEESKTEPETAPSEEESKTEPETTPSEEESKTEPETTTVAAVTEPDTVIVLSEDPTEKPTEKPTEEPSEPPVEPVTEPVTEPKTEPVTEPVVPTAPSEEKTEESTVVISTEIATEAPTQAPTESAADKAAKEILGLVNAERQKANLNPLVWDQSLAKLAEAYSKEMAENGLFSHTGKDGSTPETRLKKGGVTFTKADENLAMGSTSAQKLVDTWMKNASTKAKLLDPAFTKMGVGYGVDKAGKIYWTQYLVG